MPKTQERNELPQRAAGRLITSDIPIINSSATIAEVENLLLKKTGSLETINYIYITDTQNKLIGAISVKEVFRLPKTAKVTESMTTTLITARSHTDRERIAYLAVENHLKEIPIVDADNRLMGVVPYDAILNILREEHIEDVLKAAGVRNFKNPSINLIKAPVLTLIKKRLPWLLIGLGGSALAATIIGLFKNALESQILLAAFIPGVTYISDAVGTQSETIFIRTAAMDKSLNFKKYLWREIKIGILMAIILAAAMFAISLIFWKTIIISMILGLSFLIAIIISMIVAVLVPWISSKISLDPAFTSGPLDTILSDVLSILVYFSIANLVISFLSQ